MIIRTNKELDRYQKAAQISTKILGEVRLAIKEGGTPLQIDALADKLCEQYHVKPNFKGVPGAKSVYQHATCISVNDAVVHGIPDETPFKKGDLVKVDFGINYQGLNTDHCFTVGVGELSKEDAKLVYTAKKAVQTAAKKAVVGKTTGDLGHTMQSMVEKAGFNVVREFIGHGIGRSLHESPELPAHGQPKMGTPLIEGMVLCVEAQVVAGSPRLYTEKNCWTARTVDGKKSAMFEYMVVVGKSKPVLLTKTMDWGVKV